MKDQFTLLIVDENNAEETQLQQLLDGYRVLKASNCDMALEMAQKENVDLILVDLQLKQEHGFGTCRKIKSDHGTGDIPVLFISDNFDEKTVEQIYLMGACDYITRPIKPRELLSRVHTQLKLQRVVQKLDYLTHFDQMTGVYNRGRFFEKGLHIFETSCLNLYALMMDIDKFKSINDQYGHPVGDKVIKAVAQVMKDSLEGKSLLGRVGGEEFAVLTHQSSKESALELTEKIRTTVEKLSIPIDHQNTLKVTISAGITQCVSKHTTLDMLLKDADRALFESKHQGRNRSVFRA